MTFEPGKSGNPNGRPKGRIGLKSLIQKVWDQEIKDADGNPYIEGLLVIKAMMDKAKQGDVAAFKALAERMEGMPNQTIDNQVSLKSMPTIKKDGKEVNFDIGDPQITGPSSEASEDS